MSRTYAQQRSHDYFAHMKELHDEYFPKGQKVPLPSGKQAEYFTELYDVFSKYKDKPVQQRYGNQRKMRADMKKDDRKQVKRKSNQQFKQNLTNRNFDN